MNGIACHTDLEKIRKCKRALDRWERRNKLNGRCEKLITKVNARNKNAEKLMLTKPLKPWGCYCACSKRMNLNTGEGIIFICAFSTLHVFTYLRSCLL